MQFAIALFTFLLLNNPPPAGAIGPATMHEWLANYETVISVIWQLFLVALGIVALPILGWFKWKFVTNPKFRKGFQVTRGNGISCILPSVKFPEQDDDPEYIAFTTPFESVLFFRTLPIFAYKLGFTRPQVGLCLSEMISEPELQNNVLCLGGPIHNKISKLFLERMADQVSFEGHDLTVVLTFGEIPLVKTTALRHCSG